MRSLSPSKAFVTDVLPLAGLTADADTAPAPFACAAGFGPPGDWALISARGTCGFSIAGDGATGLDPVDPGGRGGQPGRLAGAAERGARGGGLERGGLRGDRGDGREAGECPR